MLSPLVGIEAAALMETPDESRIAEFRSKALRECLSEQFYSMLMLVGSLTVYLLMGMLFYSKAEHWRPLYSFYFCVVSLGTVGYGGKGLESTNGGTRAFTVIYIFTGIFVVLARIANLLDSITRSTRKMANAIAEFEATTACEAEKEKGSYGTAAEEGGSSAAGARTVPAELIEDVLEPPPVWRYYLVNVSISTAILMTWIAFAAAIFCATEPGLAYNDAFYFAWITATTVGYGDSEITTDGSIVWCCAFIILGTAIFTAIAAQFAAMREVRDMELRRWQLASQRQQADMMDEQLLRKLTYAAKNGKHDRLSFLIELLVHTDLVQRVEVHLLLDYFDVLDADGSGEIDMSELLLERERVVRAKTKAK